MSGSDIRKIRRNLNLTQKGLAQLVGVHKNTVARWERDELKIRVSTVKLLEFVASKSLRGNA
jgi:DNA-binding transcriptional regulator YiaG